MKNNKSCCGTPLGLEAEAGFACSRGEDNRALSETPPVVLPPVRGKEAADASRLFFCTESFDAEARLPIARAEAMLPIVRLARDFLSLAGRVSAVGSGTFSSDASASSGVAMLDSPASTSLFLPAATAGALVTADCRVGRRALGGAEGAELVNPSAASDVLLLALADRCRTEGAAGEASERFPWTQRGLYSGGVLALANLSTESRACFEAEAFALD